jgi:hypothetical protein
MRNEKRSAVEGRRSVFGIGSFGLTNAPESADEGNSVVDVY